MVARRRFLGWLALTPAGLVLTRCASDKASPDLLDTVAPLDTVMSDVGPDTTPEVGADIAVDDDADIDPPDVARVCEPTLPDALGPYYEEDAPAIVDLAGSLAGVALAMRGQILDTDCRAIAGALVEVWQADTDGEYHDDLLRASITADNDGRFAFTTIVPGRYLQATGYRPAHLHYRVSAPGFGTIVTQIYFEGDPYLRPNDSCRTCGSGDPERIIALVDRDGRKEGTCDIILAR
jgi:protocatechuate 3,4-dioxygenase beta subunit